MIKGLDLSGRVLIASNLFAIVLAVIFQYDVAVVVWSYWIESVIIGAFTFFGLILTGARTKSLGPAVSYAGFFALHYGFFHLGYLFFMVMLGIFALKTSDYLYVLLTSGILLLSHGFSFLYNVVVRMETLTQREAKMTIDSMAGDTTAVNKELEKQMNTPYHRIIPIHLTIIASGFLGPLAMVIGRVAGTVLLIIFMCFKTVGDLWAHNKKHGIPWPGFKNQD